MLHFTEFLCNQRRQIALKLIKNIFLYMSGFADYCSSLGFFPFFLCSFPCIFWYRLTAMYLCAGTTSWFLTWFINISKPHPPFPTLVSKVISSAKAISLKMLLPRQLVEETTKNSPFNFLLLLAWVIDKTTALGIPSLNRILSPLVRSTGVCW